MAESDYTPEVEAEVNEESTVEEPVVTETYEDKKAKDAMKLLKQRNEARRELQEVKQNYVPIEQVNAMNEKLQKLEEMIVSKTLEDETKIQKQDFFSKNPQAKEYEWEIDKIMSEKDLSYEESFKLYAATNKPELLMDEQYRNKANSTTNLTWVTPETTFNKDDPTAEDIKNMTPDEFLNWSNAMATKNRIDNWMSR